MPNVTLEDLTASFMSYFEGTQLLAKLIKDLCQYALSNDDTKFKLTEKRHVLQLMREYKNHSSYPLLIKQIHRQFAYPRSYNWKNWLYNSDPFPQLCIDTMHQPNQSQPFETAQMWFTSAAPIKNRSFGCLQAKSSPQQVALVSIGNSSALCTSTAKDPKKAVRMARRVSKHLVRLFNLAKTPESLLASIKIIIEDTVAYMEENMTDANSVYGTVMRIFPDPANPKQKKLVYAGVGNCDLFVLKCGKPGSEPSIVPLIIAEERFDHRLGFLSQSFRDNQGIFAKIITLDQDDVLITTSPISLSLYDRSPRIERPAVVTKTEAILPDREMRLSQDDLRRLKDSFVQAYGHNYDLDNLARTLAHTTLPVYQNLLKLTQTSYCNRQIFIKFIIENLKPAIAGFISKPSNGSTLIDFFNWLDNNAHTQLLTKKQVNTLLYFMGFECTPSSEIPITILQAACNNSTDFPRIPPYYLMVRYPETIEIDQCAVLEMAYYDIESRLANQVQSHLLARLNESQILIECRTLLTTKKHAVAYAQNDEHARFFALLDVLATRFINIEENLEPSIAEALHTLLTLLVEVTHCTFPSLGHVFQNECRQAALNIEKTLYKNYTHPGLGHDRQFALSLRLHAFGQRGLSNTPRKDAFLAADPLLPSAESEPHPPAPNRPPEKTAGLTGLDQLLELWAIARASSFIDCEELQKHLKMLAQQKYAFAYYLQALLIFNQHHIQPFSVEIFSQLLTLLKQSIHESITHAVVALGILMSNPIYDEFFDAIPCKKEPAYAKDVRHFIAWAEFLTAQSEALLLPDIYQNHAQTTLIRGLERLQHQIEQSTMATSFKSLDASTAGYLALYLLHTNHQLYSLDYASLAIDQGDPLGLYVFASLQLEQQQKQDPRFEDAFNTMRIKDNIHHNFVALLFTHILKSPTEMHLALRQFAKSTPHPIAAYLGAHPNTFDPHAVIKDASQVDFSLLSQAQTAGVFDSACLYRFFDANKSSEKVSKNGQTNGHSVIISQV